jgi:exopolyphosphatase/guanosine-5'-triphosphate,3'-diphosphate pyrophosphatase
MLRASIDIGSNSLLCLIAYVEDGKINEVKNIIRITGLGKDLDSAKAFCQEAMDDSLLALKEFKVEIEKLELTTEETIVTATEAARVAENSPDFFAKVKRELGFDVTIINSEGEAYYTALGVCKGPHLEDEENLVIMDIGGASTEFVRVNDQPFKVNSTLSLPVGSVRGTDWIIEGTFQDKMDEIFLQEELASFKSETLVCVAGSMTSLGGMLKGLNTFEAGSINGADIPFSKFSEFVDKIVDVGSEALLKQYPFLGKRADTIVAGARVARAFGINLEVEKLVISTLGLRHGTLFQGEIDGRFIEGK